MPSPEPTRILDIARDWIEERRWSRSADLEGDPIWAQLHHDEAEIAKAEIVRRLAALDT